MLPAEAVAFIGELQHFQLYLSCFLANVLSNLDPMYIINRITLKSFRIINPLFAFIFSITALLDSFYNPIEYPNILDFFKEYLFLTVMSPFVSIVMYIVPLWLFFIVGRLKVVIFGGTYVGIISSHRILFVLNSILLIIHIVSYIFFL